MDTELEAEQHHVDRAYLWLEWMRERAEWLVAGTDPLDLDVLHALRRRAASLTDGGRPLCFGRIDRSDGETFHIGRRHVEDESGEPVVVEWRAPVAEPFYRANPADPLGLHRRRQFVIDGRRIQSMADDLFGEGAGGGVPRLRGGDALLAELERSRGPEMLDIVATIQAEQDEVIRSTRAGVLVCQGGPGSGKTAVGLHRAAFLLYGDDALARQGVLVLGPNRVFLRYIAQVLPSLGEEAVVQTTVRDLAPGIRVVAADHPSAERVKGDARMGEVLARALRLGRRPAGVDLVVDAGLRRLVVTAAEVDELAAEVAGRRLSYDAGRAVLRDALIAAVVSRHPGAGTEQHPVVERAVRAAPALATALDRVWPSVAPARLVRSLVTRKKVLATAADGVLSPAEQADLLRPAVPTESLDVPSSGIPRPAWELRSAPKRPAKKREPWTAADVALLDEAAFLVTGDTRTYGHVVVDEVQDLSPMQLRMIGRRSPSGSVTLLGDLAQASGVWAPDSWNAVVEHLVRPDGWRLSELRLGYRSPGDVIELASRILPLAAPEVMPTEAVRSGRGAVRIVRAAVPSPEELSPKGVGPEELGPHELGAVVAAHTVELGARFGSVAVITDPSRFDEIETGLRRLRAEFARASDAAGLSQAVTLVDANHAKGLEFDAVVVADPAAIVASALDERRGLRLLYVALTRPTQALTVVHRGDLPAVLVDQPVPEV